VRPIMTVGPPAPGQGHRPASQASTGHRRRGDGHRHNPHAVLVPPMPVSVMPYCPGSVVRDHAVKHAVGGSPAARCGNRCPGLVIRLDGVVAFQPDRVRLVDRSSPHRETPTPGRQHACRQPWCSAGAQRPEHSAWNWMRQPSPSRVWPPPARPA
jgi:hypothetical protein